MRAGAASALYYGRMECWAGGETAAGICRLCGRGVCRVHAKELPYLTVAYTGPHGLEGLAVEAVLWCGVCKPRPEPVPLDFIFDRGSTGTAGGT